MGVAPSEEETRWSVLSPYLLQQQLLANPAVTHTVTGEGPLQGKYLGFLGPQAVNESHFFDTIPRQLGSQMHASTGPAGEWHVWGAGLSFTLLVSTQECAGVTTTVLHLVGRQACGWSLQNSWEVTGGYEHVTSCLWED